MLFSACASTHISNMNTNVSFKIHDDEARMWKRAQELEDVLNASGFVYNDEQLTNYVNEILHKLIGDYERANNVKLRAVILRDPLFNAFCLPNGTIYVHTSILANADNEAQLAALLGHESGHFLNRHQLKQFRSIVNKSAFFYSMQLALTGASGAVGADYSSSVDLARLLAEYTIIGSVFGYSREMEREADKFAFDIIVKKGYDPVEAKKFMENLYEATKDEKQKVPYFYHTHPRAKERIRNYDFFIKNLKSDKTVSVGNLKNTDKYNSMVKNVLLDNCELDMKRNNFKSAKKQVERYNSLCSKDARAYFILGKIYFLEGNKDEAEKELSKAINCNPSYPETYKTLGMICLKKDDKSQAKKHFEKYLQLNPNALDIDYIRRYLNE